MDPEVPIGQREDHRLEFVAADALRKPFSISREVVAMLNAAGGEIWIGIRADNGFAVEVQGVSNVQRVKADLLDHLIEAVEPRIRVEDVSVRTVRHGTQSVLLIRTRARENEEHFAQLKEGGRHFHIRIANRIRPMTHEEIFATGPGLLPSRLLELRQKILDEDRSGLWIGVQPIPSLKLDVQAPELETYLLDPMKSDNRTGGWNFRYPAMLGIRPLVTPGAVEYGETDSRQTTVREDGCVEFWTAMKGLHHRNDQAQELNPMALLEYPISLMRLARKLYGMLDEPPRSVQVDVALNRARGWRLPAFPPDPRKDLALECPQELEHGQFLLPSPFEFVWQEFEAHPDHSGYLLVRSIYQAFHLREDRIPEAYDRSRKCLVLGG